MDGHPCFYGCIIQGEKVSGEFKRTKKMHKWKNGFYCLLVLAQDTGPLIHRINNKQSSAFPVLRGWIEPCMKTTRWSVEVLVGREGLRVANLKRWMNLVFRLT